LRGGENVKIRKPHPTKGDETITVTLEEGKKEVEAALENRYLVIDQTETDEEKRIIKSATGLTEKSSVRIYPPVAGG
jgi:hypothetical protein